MADICETEMVVCWKIYGPGIWPPVWGIFTHSSSNIWTR